MIISTFGCAGSVKRRKFVPVGVLKHVNLKRLVSMTSRPEGRVGKFLRPGVVEDGGGFQAAGGTSCDVMAWTLWKVPARMRRSFEESFWRPLYSC